MDYLIGSEICALRISNPASLRRRNRSALEKSRCDSIDNL
jgi:hypothetical protein